MCCLRASHASHSFQRAFCKQIERNECLQKRQHGTSGQPFEKLVFNDLGDKVIAPRCVIREQATPKLYVFLFVILNLTQITYLKLCDMFC